MTIRRWLGCAAVPGGYGFRLVLAICIRAVSTAGVAIHMAHAMDDVDPPAKRAR